MLSNQVEILLRRKNKVILPEANSELPQQYLVTFCANLESVGYTCSSKLLETISSYPLEQVELINEELLRYLRELKGAHVEFKPMYPNFPQQVMEAPAIELWINARLHYLGDWFGFRYIPGYEVKPRQPLDTKDLKYKVLDLGTPEEFFQIFKDLIGSNSSLSESDKVDVVWALSRYSKDLYQILPEVIRQKETMALVCSTIIDSRLPYHGKEIWMKYIKTATDLLRLIVARSGGDISLAKATRFKSLPRSERRIYMEILDGLGDSALEDMNRYPEVWKRVGEILHPGEFNRKKKFQTACSRFESIRTNTPYRSILSQVQSLCNKGKLIEASKLLILRPGDFARRLDYLVRNARDRELDIINNFSKQEVLESISTPVLLQVMTHFKYRGNVNKFRVFFPKGNTSKFQAIENKLEKIDSGWTQMISEICQIALIERFKKLDPLGKVYVGKCFDGLTVPQGMRSASKALKTIPRLSRVPLPDGDIVRFFMWWKEPKGTRVDLDLSAYMSSSDFNRIDKVAYFNLRNESLSAVHSGDITSAPQGACEFIDINIPSFLKQEMRYVVMSVISFSGQKFSELPEAFAGFMIRGSMGKRGEIFDARTVETKFDVSTDSKMIVPLILDLERREMIWLDMGVNSRIQAGSNIQNSGQTLNTLLRSVVETRKTLLTELIDLHIKARGEYTNDLESADTIFSENQGITPWDLEKIMSDFM
jgi:stress response protein SCP2